MVSRFSFARAQQINIVKQHRMWLAWRRRSNNAWRQKRRQAWQQTLNIGAAPFAYGIIEKHGNAPAKIIRRRPQRRSAPLLSRARRGHGAWHGAQTKAQNKRHQGPVSNMASALFQARQQCEIASKIWRQSVSGSGSVAAAPAANIENNGQLSDKTGCGDGDRVGWRSHRVHICAAYTFGVISHGCRASFCCLALRCARRLA